MAKFKMVARATLKDNKRYESALDWAVCQMADDPYLGFDVEDIVDNVVQARNNNYRPFREDDPPCNIFIKYTFDGNTMTVEYYFDSDKAYIGATWFTDEFVHMLTSSRCCFQSVTFTVEGESGD